MSRDLRFVASGFFVSPLAAQLGSLIGALAQNPGLSL